MSPVEVKPSLIPGLYGLIIILVNYSRCVRQLTHIMCDYFMNISAYTSCISYGLMPLFFGHFCRSFVMHSDCQAMVLIDCYKHSVVSC